MLHNLTSKVFDGAGIWPQQAHMPSENLLTCRAVFYCRQAKDLVGLGFRKQVKKYGSKSFMISSVYVRTP